MLILSRRAASTPQATVSALRKMRLFLLKFSPKISTVNSPSFDAYTVKIQQNLVFLLTYLREKHQ
jgi:hypothetical protein